MMPRGRHILCCLLALAQPVGAGTIRPAHGDLGAALAAAQPGDEVILGPGRWPGPVLIDRPLTLTGEPGAVIDGQGKGHVIEVTAPDVTIRGLTVTASGADLDRMDSGVFLAKTAERALVEGNRFEDNLHGVRIQGADDAMVRGNVIVGRTGRQADLGNGVSVWNAPGAAVVGNRISHGRDGIFSNSSKRNLFRDNRIEGARFALHYMYTNNSEVTGNVSIRNAMGFAIMFSDRLTVTGNLSEDDRDYGFLFNSANNSTLGGNRVIGRPASAARWRDAGISEEGVPVEASIQGGDTRLAPEKCVFIYSANRNRFRGNHFEGCAIGIHFTAGAEGNILSGNNFIGNRVQVKYVGTRYLEWSEDGRGNYWSDNAGFDLNGDGIADSPYRPNDMIDEMMWAAPQARLLLTSPAVQIIRWAQDRFPAVLPGGVTDSAPLMFPMTPEERPGDDTDSPA